MGEKVYNGLGTEIESQKEYINNFIKLNDIYCSNKEIIKMIDEQLKPMDEEMHFPFDMLMAINSYIPKLIGDLREFITYILLHGVQYEKELKHINEDLCNELKTLTFKHGIAFVCAQKFIDNPMDYAATQLISSGESNKSYLRIIRADKKTFDLHIDIDTMHVLIGHLVEKLNSAMETQERKGSEEQRAVLMKALYEFLKISDVIEDEPSR